MSNGIPTGMAIERGSIPVSRIEGAMLGVAIGDALGWPQERPRTRVDKPAHSAEGSAAVPFQSWKRRTGGRFASHIEVIRAGEYSDDTQLLLATARSLTSSNDWYAHFCWWELPLWLLYERGGGGATLQAVRQWQKGTLPWQDSEQGHKYLERYFMAGGNGVAMRILPHAILQDQTPDLLFRQIFLNGIATHAHPRALLGAQLYGYALWVAARLAGPLKYGELIEHLLDAWIIWSEPPQLIDEFREWAFVADKVFSGSYIKIWNEVVEELLSGLRICKTAVAQGALSTGREVIGTLGVFDPKVGGAGTVSALAALYLASRYAAEPTTGLLEAAFAKGADTDTIGSMVGGLLGALHGREWIHPEWEPIQDKKYLLKIANALAQTQSTDSNHLGSNDNRWTAYKDRQVFDALDAGVKSVNLGPLGQCGVLGSTELQSITKSIRAIQWKLETPTSQSLYIKRLTRQNGWSNNVTQPPADEPLLEGEYKHVRSRGIQRADQIPKTTAKGLGYSNRVTNVYPERANLYPLTISSNIENLYLFRQESNNRIREEVYFEEVEGSIKVEPSAHHLRRAITRSILENIKRGVHRVSRRFNTVINVERNYAPSGTPLRIYPSFKLRVFDINNTFYLCVDHQLVVRAILSLAALVQKDPSFRPNYLQRVLLRTSGESAWDEAYLADFDLDKCHLRFSSGSELVFPASEIYPELTRSQISQVAPKLGIKASDLERLIKQYSFLIAKNAPLARLAACTEFVEELCESSFPIREGNVTLNLKPSAAVLRPPHFITGKNLQEPLVSFDHVDRSKRGQDISKGLMSYGAYEKPTSSIRLVLLTTQGAAHLMENLVQRLNKGSMRFQGAQKTFQSEIVIQEIITSKSVDEYEDRIRDFVRTGTRKNTNVALVYLPKEGDVDNWRHPYYRTKALLLKEGLVSQMVDKKTVLNPEWRDLNLALNIYAKAGYTPWVLDEAIDDADLFIGLSSSQVKRGNTVIRMMGYVNVFDSYGRWKFYQGDSIAFRFAERLDHYKALVKNSIASYQAENGGELRTIHIHLTKQFSLDERKTIANAVRTVVPAATVVFVSINSDHHLRLYDLSERGDGSIHRSTYLCRDSHHLYLATTGNNTFHQPVMGTPVPLELSIWADPPSKLPNLDKIGQQVLSLTRLNWASSRSFCHEPITTKFAGDIAHLMTAFMEDPDFTVNPSLRGTPWFL